MASGFDGALRFVLRWEGGLSDDPADRGGRTMKGVTQQVYDSWRAANRLPATDVAGISDAELGAIYRSRYWEKASCDVLRAQLDLVQFDTAVNMGPGRAVKILQQTVGVDADGAFGPNTRTACDACDPPDAVARYCSIREGLYHRFAEAPGQDRFLRGWLNRLNDLRVEAGVPGFARKRDGGVDFGEADWIARIPDLAPNAPLEAWR
ncbi:glycoside hydrolase family 108 protein [Falsiroseomonas sp. HC035]|uniref:glycoside hydrolase family 108 protein n=1 Tax=Falsiroseomonas sp. HC035 TaxID=3390999 RepID=UPI003D310319